jgi:hypothetical protein
MFLDSAHQISAQLARLNQLERGEMANGATAFGKRHGRLASQPFLRMLRKLHQLAVRGGIAIEEKREGFRQYFFGALKGALEKGEVLLSRRGRKPALPLQPAVNRDIPQHAVAALQKMIVSRAGLGFGKIRLVAKMGIEHIDDVQKLVAKKFEKRFGLR